MTSTRMPRHLLSMADLDADQLRIALGLRTDELIAEETV